MNYFEGNIVDIQTRSIFKGRVYYSNKIESIEKDDNISSDLYILPGLIDAHVHIESSMCTPVNYAQQAFKHGVVAAVTDPHEIANVSGIDGVMFMYENSKNTPMKIYTGAPSCVPATPFESSGSHILLDDIEYLFKNNICSHLSEMMNYPGLLNGDKSVLEKVNISKKHNKKIDGHAPLLSGNDLKEYYNNGISTDHECTNIDEAIEKIEIGFKIMLRKSSASNDFENLYPLIDKYPGQLMLCTDDCHPDDLMKGYIDVMVKRLLNESYSIFDVIQVSTINAKEHYSLNVGLLQLNDPADFIVIENLTDFNVQKTVVDGNIVFDVDDFTPLQHVNEKTINNFYVNKIGIDDIRIPILLDRYKVIDLIENSLLTNYFTAKVASDEEYIESDIGNDILKMVVLNRYMKAKPSVAFIHGFNIKSGAIATTVSHDSHNIVSVGTNDNDIVKAISKVQDMKGGMVYVNGNESSDLPLPVAGLMSDQDCSIVAKKYEDIASKVKMNGCGLHAPFMTLSFMSLLVIPKLKLCDKGLFDGEKFEFTNLQVSNE